MTPLSMMRPMQVRRLAAAERTLATSVFGGAIDLGRVRILALPVWPRAFVPSGRLIAWPAAEAFNDFGGDDTPLRLQARLVHELTHVWQAQQGVNLLLAKIRCGDSAAAYAYDLERGPEFGRLNIEQQAMAVEHSFLARRGARTPHAAEVYLAALPDWRRA